MNDSQFDIAQIIHELSDIPTSDCLVSLSEHRTKQAVLADFPSENSSFEVVGIWKELWKQADHFRTEADLQTLCVASGLIQWEFQGKKLETPILLTQLDWNYIRLSKTISITPLLEITEINPYVKFVLKELQIDIPTEFDALEHIEDKLNCIKELLFNYNHNWTFIDSFTIGNFHYHRFYLLRELEGISESTTFSNPLQTILGNVESSPETMSLSAQNLIPADRDQLLVFDSIQTNDTVVNGPPGTGKSQVLVNILGKSLTDHLKTIVVSEKKVALDVLVKKLSEQKLDKFSFVFHSQVKAKDFLQHLKKTWKYLETLEYGAKNELYLTKQYQDKLQLLLDRLNSPNLFSGVSYAIFNELKKETPLDSSLFNSRAPDVSDWLLVKNELVQLSNQLNGFASLACLKPALFENEGVDIRFQEVRASYTNLLTVFPELTTKQQLERFVRASIQCQVVNNEFFKPYSQLISKPKVWSQFVTQVEVWKKLQIQLSEAEKEQQIWKLLPATSQVKSWKSADTWWRKRSRNRSIKKLLNDTSVSPEIALSHWDAYQSLRNQIDELGSYFHKLGITTSVVDLDLGLSFAAQLQREDQNELAEIAGWTMTQRKQYIQHTSQVKQVDDFLDRYFYLSEFTSIRQFFEDKSNEIISLSVHQPLINRLKPIYFELFQTCRTWKDVQSLILSTNWQKLAALYPELTKYEPKQINQLLKEINQVETEDCKNLAVNIQQQIRSTFMNYNELLREGTRKLNADDKQFRQQLKNGKAILVKEFSKSKSHKSIRFLLESDARFWIQTLVPIWLATPVQVSNFFPLQKQLFDLVLFDEASQIALPNALGALFRSKRALIAGDSQQMSPSTFFGKNYRFHDLLHQASYYYQKVDLHHHYRSENADLIRFSNEHFYDNKLIVYPSPIQKQVVFHHPCPNGIFENRRNINEAKQVAVLLEKQCLEPKCNIGIVAFSEEQLNEIWKNCSEQTKQHISTGIDEKRIFFKALGNVQGDEAEVLIIGLGYAKDETGNFHMRFGPLNQENGYKRLNVLLTRAKKEMHVFTSISSTDFSITENESVRLLQRFIYQLESGMFNGQKPIELPFQIPTDSITQTELTIKNAQVYFPIGVELSTFHAAMKQRGWKIKFE